MRVEYASATDLPAVRAVYADAGALQRARGPVSWLEFPDESILGEMAARQLLRVMDGDALVGVFSMRLDDALIWGALERGEHVYLHRIARVASFQGRGFLDTVIDWAWTECRALGRAGLRIDTWASSTALIALYGRYGFRVVAVRRIGEEPRLQPHYHGIELALLEAEQPGAGVAAI